MSRALDEMRAIGEITAELSAGSVDPTEAVDKAIDACRVRLRRLEIIKRMMATEAPKKRRRRKSAAVAAVADVSASENGGEGTP